MGMYDDIQWDVPIDNPTPAPQDDYWNPTGQFIPQPDNINWGNIFDGIGQSMTSAVSPPYGSGGGTWGGTPDWNSIPTFATDGFADDQQHAYDPIGTWGSYPLDAQYNELGGKYSTFYVPQNNFSIDPGFNPAGINSRIGYNTNYQPKLPQLRPVDNNNQYVYNTLYGPPSYEDAGTQDLPWQNASPTSLFNSLPQIATDSYGNTWGQSNGQWNLIQSSNKGSW